MLAHVTTAAVRGVDSYLVRVEVNLAPGLPAFAVVGLADGAVREGRERVGAALRNVGRPIPPRRITVNLAPADIRKDGSAFDLPVAVGLLAAAGHLAPERLEGIAFLGELGLDGSLRPVRGVLPCAARCAASGVRALIVPAANAREAAVVRDLEVFGALSLGGVAAHLDGSDPLVPVSVDVGTLLSRSWGGGPDLHDVKGQEGAKRALEIAAAGAHNVLMIGPPGSGKTMLARRLPGILPPLTLSEALEATGVHSVAGCLPPGEAVVTARPFRAPHHTVSDAGMVGGGTPIRPGEISLAHHGVLFLDELAEFRRNVLEVLRQPLEDGTVRLSRARGSERFPARFLMVGAMNPCPCGYHGDGTDRCLCDPALVARYRGRVSGPLMDRLDLHVEVPAVPFERLADELRGEPTARVQARVARSRAIQAERFAGVPGVHANGQMDAALLRRFVRIRRRAAAVLRRAVDQQGLSARAYHRVLKVARTIADLEGAEEMDPRHALEAIQFRTLDRRDRA
jgi:magnesium chelatase family protein